MTNQEQYQLEQITAIREKIAKLTEVTEQWYEENKNTNYGDLGAVHNDLADVLGFISNGKY